MDIPPLAEVRRLTEKKRDAWWTVLLVDPVATPLVRVVARWPRITPNGITWGALFLGLGAAVCFWFADWKWLLLGAGLYHLSFILDCMDGKLARLTGRGSEFGGWLDYVFDRIRVLACAIALMGGQYNKTGDIAFVWLALAVVFLDMLRYIDALQIFKVRHSMRKKIKTRAKAFRRAQEEQYGEQSGDNEAGLAFMEDLLRENPTADLDNGDETAADAEAKRSADGVQPELDADGQPIRKKEVIDLHVEFKGRFPWYGRFRTFLLRHRIRTHLISGIEFQMAVFIIGPLLGAVMPVTIVAGALLMVFELAIIYKLLLSTKDFERTLAKYPVPEQPEQPVIPAQPDGSPSESAATAESATAARQ
ncbi:CDP-alcohol phosphatidyltransferase family protein [Streptomyces alkaliterrae]|uniref:CDP-alcohol phosphatidyltransferase family protein n=1 Tax=Streptomyces alkaliterrae TaxID=2213162 RepID=A0A5P0YMA7_9ACTN|nr:CDP-alcohol phosphatidyltransferase family protein [Streptomyces alkaliterrae]MBB1259720.1 CDP-alcohol phosphatidyltransferase family protein [Streptomyces alkaliterrae]MQS01040.1 CDP-alcohol phosphatidyltransferase family protein [Streptomyces alkaliterrae]